MTTILVVDDETDVEYIVRRRFRLKVQQGLYDFRFVHNGQDALTLLQNESSIDLVLLDINMPALDGLMLLEQLPLLNPILQVVMVSAYGDMANIRQAMNKGAFDFVGKPIDMLDLERTIDKTIQHIQHLREAQQLKIIDELKTRFFDNITHEFRTPLTLILTPLGPLLREFANQPKLHQSLLTIDRNARQLLRLINQLLDLAKLESGQFRVSPVAADLGEFMDGLIADFIPLAEARQLQLTYANDLAGLYIFDPAIMESITYNLLTNAIKFTHKGFITVSLSIISSDNSPRQARLSVQDTGIGIEADKLAHIFNRFYQAHELSTLTSQNASWAGTGIGLALVNELSHLLNGTLRVESITASHTAPDVQTGTCFTLDWPLLPAHDESTVPFLASLSRSILLHENESTNFLQASSQTITTSESTELPLLLVVDDNEALRIFLADSLAPQFRILTASNGAEAWELAQQELPDIVVSDVMMPVMDGYAFTHQLKTNPLTDHIAVILLTAKASHQSILDGLTKGADDYIAKPFHLDELQLRIANQLDRQQKLRQYYLQQLSPSTTAVSPPLSLDPFLERLYALIDANLDAPLSVEWVADELAMSRKTLYRKVQSLTQLAPNELIRNYRLRQGAALLQTGQAVSQVAYQVGFETPSHFAQAFRDLYGQTPTEFAHR